MAMVADMNQSYLPLAGNASWLAAAAQTAGALSRTSVGISR